MSMRLCISVAPGSWDVAVRSACRMKVAVSNASGNACRNTIEACNTVKELLITFCMISF